MWLLPASFCDPLPLPFLQCCSEGGGYGGDKYGDFGSDLGKINWEGVELVPFTKNFYVEHDEVKAMDEKDVAKIRADAEMVVQGKDVRLPVFIFRSFADIGSHVLINPTPPHPNPPLL